MYLKSLELSGFKSFAKKAKLDFTSQVTAIVGPNGSGKSNVAEGFRFALGEQRVSAMRGKRTEDLIWNGSHTMGRAGRAKVSLTFDNTPKKGARLLDIDFDEVSVERVVHRDSSTDYLINGSAVRRKDIVELLAGANIGASGHHIISQGETDRILNVTPKERKVMLEEALGLKVFHYKKDESLRKLEKTEVNKGEVEAMRRELKPHLAFLKRQVEKIQKAHEMREELKALYKEYLQHEDFLLAREEKRLKEARTPLQNEYDELEKKHREATEALRRVEGGEDKAEKILAFERELADVRGRKDEISRELGRIEGAIEALKKAHESQKKQEDVGKKVSLTKVEDFVRELQKTFEEVHTASDVGVVQSIIIKAKTYAQGFLDSLRGEEKENVSESLDIEAQQEEKRALEKKFEDITHEEKRIERDYDSLRKEVEADQHSSREAERAVFAITTEQTKLRSKLEHIENETKILQIRREAFNEEKMEAEAFVGHESIVYKQVVDSEYEVNEEEHAKQRKHIERLKIRLEDAGGGSGDEILKEYEDVTERDSFLEHELEDLEKSTASLRDLIAELDDELQTTFKKGIQKINAQFGELFAVMFGGGTAALKVVREEIKKPKDTDIEAALSDDVPEEVEEGEEGVEITLSLPRKKIKGLQMLSGGERALTSIALLFAMSQVNPPPFLVLDETDAALDEANSRRYGDMIERLAQHSQLIVITHNRETMSRAGVLYGVTMGSDGVSQLLSVSFDEGVQFAK